MLRRPLVALTVLAVAGRWRPVQQQRLGLGRIRLGGGSGGAASTSKPPSGMATVTAASTKLGMVLVDGSGRTLYLFEKDSRPVGLQRRSCRCLAGRPDQRRSGGQRRPASLLGTISRSDGTTQVTNQHPLYYYSGDNGAGQETARALTPSARPGL